MNAVFKTIVATVAYVFITQSSKAQVQLSDYEIGITGGTLVYQGDLVKSPLGSLSPFHFALGLNVRKKLTNYFSIRGNLTFGKISADESSYTTPEWKPYRGFAFSTSVTELTGQLLYHILGENTEKNYHTFSPYVFAGAGFTFLNVKRDWSKFNTTYFGNKSQAAVGLGIDTLHKTPSVIPVIPIGAGVGYQLSNRLMLNAEASFRFTLSDYIDGFSYAANPKGKDAYYGISVGVSYKLGRNTVKCPPIRR